MKEETLEERTSRFNNDSVESFLQQEHIGPVTGLSIFLAHTRRYDQIPKIHEDIKPRIYAGMILYYIITEDEEGLTKVRESAGCKINDSDILKYTNSLEFAKTRDHRFIKAIDDYAVVEKVRRKLEKSLQRVEGQIRTTANTTLPPERDQFLIDRDKEKFEILHELFGISLVGGNLKEISDYVCQIEEIPRWKKYDSESSVTHTLNYLTNGGWEVLKQEEGFNRGFNPHWWSERFGPKGRERHIYSRTRDFLRDEFTSLVLWSVLTTLLIDKACK